MTETSSFAFPDSVPACSRLLSRHICSSLLAVSESISASWLVCCRFSAFCDDRLCVLNQSFSTSFVDSLFTSVILG